MNFYRILREEDGLPVPQKRKKKVKSGANPSAQKVNFPTPPEPEKVKFESAKPLENLVKVVDKVVTTKERKDKEEQPVFLSPQDGADAPEKSFISPEVARKFNLRYGIEEWPPQRRKD